MKILIVSTIFPPEIGGPSKHIYELAKNLSSLGHEIHIATYTKKNSVQEFVDGFHIHRVSIGNLPKIFLPIRVLKMKVLLLKIVRKYNIDILYALNIDLAGLPASMAAKKTNKPIILRYGGDYIWEIMFKFNKTSRTLDDFYKNQTGLLFSILKKFQSNMLKKFNHIIVPSFYYKNILVNAFSLSQDKISVIKNPVNINYKINKKKNDRFILVTASRIIRLKGLDYLILAVKEAIKKYKDINLIIIGDGPYKNNLISKVKKLNIQDYIKFLPGMSHNEVLNHLSNADVYVLSSISEVAPNVILEAMSLKTPVITTRVSDLDYTMNEKIALIVPPKDSLALANAIIKLKENPKLRAKLAFNGCNFVKKNITWGEVLNQITLIMEKAKLNS